MKKIMRDLKSNPKSYKFGKMVALILVIVILFAASLFTAPISTDRVIRMYVDGTEIVFNADMGYPIISNSRTLVPIRIISDYMGYTTDWSESTWNQGIRKVWVKGEDISIELDVDKIYAKVNGKTVPVDPRRDANGVVTASDTKVILHNGRTYVPVTFIAENMGATVTFKQSGDVFLVYINRGGNTEIPEPTEPTPPTPTEPTVPTVPTEPTTPAVGFGTLTGNATLTEQAGPANIEAIDKFLGDHADATFPGMFNPIGQRENYAGSTRDSFFFYVVDREDRPIEIKIRQWYLPKNVDNSGTKYLTEYRMLNETVKKVFEYYLPKGGTNLYKVVDDGYNNRWDDASNYLKVDLRPIIGNDGYKVDMYSSQGYLIISIHR